MRRIGTALFISLLSISSVYAGNYGFYGGVGLGYGDLRFDTKFNIDAAAPSTTSILLMDNHTITRDFVSQIRAGYANGYRYEAAVLHWWDRFHWAIETYLEPQSHSVHSERFDSGAEVEYHMKFNYGVILKPGLQTTLNTTFQIYAGVVRADFTKIQTNPGFDTAAQIGNQGKSDTGYRVGLGFEGRLNRNMSLELAVMRTYFSNKSTERILNPQVVDDLGNVYTLEKLSFKPRFDQIMVNFNYYLIR